MNLQDESKALLQKEMNRKDFLKLVGVGVVALTGVSSLLKTLSTLGGDSAPSRSLGYGSSPYGGDKKS